MIQITGNKAAWIPFEKAKDLEVGPGPKPNPTENEVVIKVAFAAVNPTDWKNQDSPYLKLEYPAILGTDVSGTIVQLGSSVTRFKIGQRVIAHCDSLHTKKASNSGFQGYATAGEILVSAIPESLPLGSAVVLPLSISTAATGLFKTLKLPFPLINPNPTGKSILIWGGSSSVGSSAIQLAVAAGLTVIAVAGPANQDYVLSLGATYAIDHKSLFAVDQIIGRMKSGDYAFDTISTPETQETCAEVLHQLGGGTLAVVYPNSEKCKFDEVNVQMIMGLDPGFANPEIGDAVWRKYIPEALAKGKFQAKPDPYILKGGLARVQYGINLLRKGVSAKKIVIEIGGEP